MHGNSPVEKMVTKLCLITCVLKLQQNNKDPNDWHQRNQILLHAIYMGLDNDITNVY